MNDLLPATPRRFTWPVAFTVITITVVVAATLGGLYVFNALRRAPAEALEGGRELLKEVQEIARAFNTGTVTTSFVSYATEVSGTNYLQFATLDQMEIFELADRATTLWGNLDLPEVLVEARAPVQYTYYLDLNSKWQFSLEGDRVTVVAPEIRFNRPALNPSAIQYDVRAGSVFRDEEVALEKLRAGLATMAERRAEEHIPVVRELGRLKTVEFVENWLLQSFGEATRQFRVEVRFADEAEVAPTTELELPTASPEASAPMPQ